VRHAAAELAFGGVAETHGIVVSARSKYTLPDGTSRRTGLRAARIVSSPGADLHHGTPVMYSSAAPSSGAGARSTQTSAKP
jgi:hypothetical protein